MTKNKYDFKKGFNIVGEMPDYEVLSNSRLEYGKFWTGKLLLISLILNIITIVSIGLTGFILFSKDTADFYGSTPKGIIYKLEKVN